MGFLRAAALAVAASNAALASDSSLGDAWLAERATSHRRLPEVSYPMDAATGGSALIEVVGSDATRPHTKAAASGLAGAAAKGPGGDRLRGQPAAGEWLQPPSATEEEIQTIDRSYEETRARIMMTCIALSVIFIGFYAFVLWKKPSLARAQKPLAGDGPREEPAEAALAKSSSVVYGACAGLAAKANESVKEDATPVTEAQGEPAEPAEPPAVPQEPPIAEPSPELDDAPQCDATPAAEAQGEPAEPPAVPQEPPIVEPSPELDDAPQCDEMWIYALQSQQEDAGS